MHPETIWPIAYKKKQGGDSFAALPVSTIRAEIDAEIKRCYSHTSLAEQQRNIVAAVALERLRDRLCGE